MIKQGEKIRVITCDAGGTMTDMFLLKANGTFGTGKASTTPRDESISYWNALKDAAGGLGIDWEKSAGEHLSAAELAIYSGTAMLNSVLQGVGVICGLITTKGYEDMFVHERSRGAYAGYSYTDRLHKVTHRHNEPMINSKMVRGVRGRINAFGQEIMPLSEGDIRDGMAHLLDKKVEAVIICFPFSYLNPTHELKAAEIIAGELQKKGITDVPVYLSCQICPIMREVSRVTATTIHAKVTPIARNAFLKVEGKIRKNGYKYPLQIVLGSGGLATSSYPRLQETLFSGPIGGLIGTQYISEVCGQPNWIATDLGGTSFDVGLVMGGRSPILREVEVARHVINIPTLSLDSIGAGTGCLVVYDPGARRILVGPRSAGAEPGPVCYKMGNDIPTVMDCLVVNGIINPDYYLGGSIKLDAKLAEKAIREKCSEPAGMDLNQFNQLVIDIISSRIREHVRTVVGVRGFPLGDFNMLCYGGAGPILAAACAEGLGVKGVATLPFAAVFSAFGCACMDLVHRYQKSTLVMIPYGVPDEYKVQMGQILNLGWDALEQTARQELAAEGLEAEKAEFIPIAYMRYGIQLEDVEVPLPIKRINSVLDMDKLIGEFERIYEQIYYTAAKYPQAGYNIFEQGLMVRVPQMKPDLPRLPLGPAEPSASARKGERPVFWKDKWSKAALFEMGELRPGNEVKGAAVVEAPDTTLFVPPDWKIRMDDLQMIWLERGKKQ